MVFAEVSSDVGPKFGGVDDGDLVGAVGKGTWGRGGRSDTDGWGDGRADVDIVGDRDGS